ECDTTRHVVDALEGQVDQLHAVSRLLGDRGLIQEVMRRNLEHLGLEGLALPRRSDAAGLCALERVALGGGWIDEKQLHSHVTASRKMSRGSRAARFNLPRVCTAPARVTSTAATSRNRIRNCRPSRRPRRNAVLASTSASSAVSSSTVTCA